LPGYLRKVLESALFALHLAKFNASYRKWRID
jgi:hypothetical protein